MHGAGTNSIVRGLTLEGLQRRMAADANAPTVKTNVEATQGTGHDAGPMNLFQLKHRAVQLIWRAMIGEQSTPDHGIELAFRVLSVQDKD